MTDESQSRIKDFILCTLKTAYSKKSIDLDKYLIKTSEVMLTTLTYSLKKTDLK